MLPIYCKFYLFSGEGMVQRYRRAEKTKKVAQDELAESLNGSKGQYSGIIKKSNKQARNYQNIAIRCDMSNAEWIPVFRQLPDFRQSDNIASNTTIGATTLTW